MLQGSSYPVCSHMWIRINGHSFIHSFKLTILVNWSIIYIWIECLNSISLVIWLKSWLIFKWELYSEGKRYTLKNSQMQLKKRDLKTFDIHSNSDLTLVINYIPNMSKITSSIIKSSDNKDNMYKKLKPISCEIYNLEN